ncbi:MAG: hypothetical protein L0323_22140 [Planctomycetes bacterium]|nr:hypothetical protein [Planctomycetota bacterium]
MKEGDERKGFGLSGPWLQVTFLLALAAGNLLRDAPFEAERPPGHPEMLPPGRVSALQAIPARSWEDPLAAAHVADSNGRNSEEGGSLLVGRDAPATGKMICDRVLEIAGNPASVDAGVVLVLLPGGPYAEDHETRLRTRQALQAAFLAEEFQGLDSRRIGGVWISRRRGGTETEPSAGRRRETPEPMLLAYELWTREKQAVLVLWVDEEQVADRFNDRLDEIRSQLLEPPGAGGGKSTESPNARSNSNQGQEGHAGVKWRVRVVGPSNSDDLGRIVDALPKPAVPKGKRPRKEASPKAEDPIHVFSPWATAVEEGMYDAREGIVQVVRTIGHDRKLARLLIDELVRRGCWATREDQAILLVAEADTAYGSSWIDHFRGELGSPTPGSQGASSSERTEDRFILREYLRGLDGTRGLGGDANEKSGDGGGRPTEEEPALEVAEGNSQLDYVRRLQAELARTLDPSAPRKVVAIGVFGSEIHDKLLILQALRPIAGSIPIFTTDLDARFSERRRWRYARNLIVATHYGLALSEDYQKRAPPFRDGYQTSAFVAFRMAIHSLSAPRAEFPPEADRRVPWVFEVHDGPSNYDPIPRLFEIGRRGPVDLTVGTGGDSAAFDISPPRPSMRLGQALAWWGLGLALLGLLCLTRPARAFLHAARQAWRDLDSGSIPASAAGARQFLRRLVTPPCLILLVAGAALSLLVATVAFVMHEHGSDDGERFDLLDGTSAWPCLLLRALAVAVALATIWVTWRGFQDCVARIDNDLLPVRKEPDSGEGEAGPPSGRGRSVRDLLRALSRSSIDSWARSAPGKKGDDLWRDFRSLHRPKPTAVRLSLRFLLWTLVLFGCYRAFAIPVRPIRGDMARAVDSGLLWASAGLAGLVMLLLTDRARAFRHLAGIFEGRAVEWKPAVLRRLRPGMQEPRAVAELLEMRILERLSELLSRWVFLPAAVVMLLLAARSSYFDYWGSPPAILLPLAALALLLVVSVVLLRKTARRAREDSLDTLRSLAAGGEGDPGEAGRADIAFAKEEIESMQRGAFRPFSEEPLLHAVLVPLGGIGVLEYLDHFLSL